MKKLVSLLFIASVILTLSGCSFTEQLESFLASGDPPVPETTQTKNRVYMDKITGTLSNFTGRKVSIKSDDKTYSFNLSDATIESEKGMIRGDEISIIYEGQLDGTDTSNVKALKVVDEYHKKSELKNRKVYGSIQSFTPNSITLTTEAGNTATYPIIAAEQYYQNGISPGDWVYLHFQGNYKKSETDAGTVYSAHQVKVLSISDVEPFKVSEIDSSKHDKQMKATILDIKTNILTVSMSNYENTFDIDLSDIPCYFKGGVSQGSTIYITYQGEFDGETFASVLIREITGQDPATIKKSKMSSYVIGEIIGTTANTITLQTSEGIPVTFNVSNSTNASAKEMSKGNWIKILFDSSKSKSTNVHTAIRIDDV